MPSAVHGSKHRLISLRGLGAFAVQKNSRMIFSLNSRNITTVSDLKMKRLFLRLCGTGNCRFANRGGVGGYKNDISPRPILGIIDDRIPDATRGVGATGGSPLRSPSTIITLPNGVNIGILTKPFGNADFKFTCNGTNGFGDNFFDIYFVGGRGSKF